MANCYSFFLFLLCLILTSCSGGQGPMQPDKVKIQLKYVHQAQFAGLYVAEKNGYYRDENIEIEFIEGGGGNDLIAPVVAGDADFGIASSSHLLISRTEGAPIKAIAAIYRRSASIFVSKVGSGILRPHDMVGKKVAVYLKNAKEYEYELRAMLKKLDIDIGSVELVDIDRQYGGFIDGDIDVTGAYVTGGAMRLKAQGVELNYIWPLDYGIDFYSDTIFVSDTLLQNNRDLVQRFLRASLKGWDYAIRNSSEAVDITMMYAKIKEHDLQSRMMDAQHPLIYTGENAIGWMEKRVWQGMHNILCEQGVVTKPLVNISSAYTNEFVEELYQKD